MPKGRLPARCRPKHAGSPFLFHLITHATPPTRLLWYRPSPALLSTREAEDNLYRYHDLGVENGRMRSSRSSIDRIVAEHMKPAFLSSNQSSLPLPTAAGSKARGFEKADESAIASSGNSSRSTGSKLNSKQASESGKDIGKAVQAAKDNVLTSQKADGRQYKDVSSPFANHTASASLSQTSLPKQGPKDASPTQTSAAKQQPSSRSSFSKDGPKKDDNTAHTNYVKHLPSSQSSLSKQRSKDVDSALSKDGRKKDDNTAQTNDVKQLPSSQSSLSKQGSKDIDSAHTSAAKQLLSSQLSSTKEGQEKRTHSGIASAAKQMPSPQSSLSIQGQEKDNQSTLTNAVKQLPPSRSSLPGQKDASPAHINAAKQTSLSQSLLSKDGQKKDSNTAQTSAVNQLSSSQSSLSKQGSKDVGPAHSSGAKQVPSSQSSLTKEGQDKDVHFANAKAAKQDPSSQSSSTKQEPKKDASAAKQASQPPASLLKQEPRIDANTAHTNAARRPALPTSTSSVEGQKDAGIARASAAKASSTQSSLLKEGQVKDADRADISAAQQSSASQHLLPKEARKKDVNSAGTSDAKPHSLPRPSSPIQEQKGDSAKQHSTAKISHSANSATSQHDQSSSTAAKSGSKLSTPTIPAAQARVESTSWYPGLDGAKTGETPQKVEKSKPSDAGSNTSSSAGHLGSGASTPSSRAVPPGSLGHVFPPPSPSSLSDAKAKTGSESNLGRTLQSAHKDTARGADAKTLLIETQASRSDPKVSAVNGSNAGSLSTSEEKSRKIDFAEPNLKTESIPVPKSGSLSAVENTDVSSHSRTKEAPTHDSRKMPASAQRPNAKPPSSAMTGSNEASKNPLKILTDSAKNTVVNQVPSVDKFSSRHSLTSESSGTSKGENRPKSPGSLLADSPALRATKPHSSLGNASKTMPETSLKPPEESTVLKIPATSDSRDSSDTASSKSSAADVSNAKSPPSSAASNQVNKGGSESASSFSRTSSLSPKITASVPPSPAASSQVNKGSTDPASSSSKISPLSPKVGPSTPSGANGEIKSNLADSEKSKSASSGSKGLTEDPNPSRPSATSAKGIGAKESAFGPGSTVKQGSSNIDRPGQNSSATMSDAFGGAKSASQPMKEVGSSSTAKSPEGKADVLAKKVDDVSQSKADAFSGAKPVSQPMKKVGSAPSSTANLSEGKVDWLAKKGDDVSQPKALSTDQTNPVQHLGKSPSSLPSLARPGDGSLPKSKTPEDIFTVPNLKPTNAKENVDNGVASSKKTSTLDVGKASSPMTKGYGVSHTTRAPNMLHDVRNPTIFRNASQSAASLAPRKSTSNQGEADGSKMTSSQGVSDGSKTTSSQGKSDGQKNAAGAAGESSEALSDLLKDSGMEPSGEIPEGVVLGKGKRWTNAEKSKILEELVVEGSKTIDWSKVRVQELKTGPESSENLVNRSPAALNRKANDLKEDLDKITKF